MRCTLPLTIAIILLLGASAAPTAPAQDTSPADLQPVVTVSVASLDSLMKDFQALATAANAPQLGMMAQMATGPQGLAGMDGSKPLGAVLRTDGQDFSVLAFLPILDIGQFLQNPALEDAPVSGPDAEGVYDVNIGGQALYLQQKGDWAFLVTNRDDLADTPADPVPLLGGLQTQYAVAVRVDVNNVPQAVRQEYVEGFKEAAESRASGPDPDPSRQSSQAAVLGSKFTDAMTEAFARWIMDTDHLLLGLAFDQPSSSLKLAFVRAYVAGSPSAQDVAESANVQTSFAGFFVPDAAVAIQATAKLSEVEATKVKDAIALLRARFHKELDKENLPAQDDQMARKTVGDFMDVITATLDGRRLDAASSVVAGDGSVTWLGGIHVADTEKLDGALKQMVAMIAKEEPGLGDLIQLDAEEHQGVRFHVATLPAGAIPADEMPPALAGAEISLVLGIGDQAAYFAVGTNATAVLKQAIDQSRAEAGKAVPLEQISLSASSFGRLLEVIGAAEEPGPGGMIVDVLTQITQSDHLTVTTTAIQDGKKTELVVEPGALEAIGGMVMGMMMDGPGGPGALE